MRGGHAEKGQITERVQIFLLQVVPEMRRYVHRRFIGGECRWILLAAALLHLKVSFAKRVRALRKIIAGKLTAISQAVFNLIHSGTGQNGAGTAKYPVLCGQFLFSFRTFA